MNDLAVSPRMTVHDDSELSDEIPVKGASALSRNATVIAIWTVEQFAREAGCTVEELRLRAQGGQALDEDASSGWPRDR
jgi:hypothetical protein